MVIRFAEVAEELFAIVWSMIFSFSVFSWPGMFLVESSAISTSGGSGSGLIGGGSFGLWTLYPKSNVAIVVAVTAMAGVALAATFAYSHSGSIKSPWSRRRRKHALLPKQWKSFFTTDGRLFDRGIKLLKKVRSGGVDPSIRAEVWPFLLGLYDVDSSKEERDTIRMQKRKEYYNLREQCQRTIHEHTCGEVLDSSSAATTNPSSNGKANLQISNPNNPLLLFGAESDPSDEHGSETIISEEVKSSSSSSSDETTVPESTHGKADGLAKIPEGFETWRKIIRLDAVRANSEWVRHSPSQAAVSEMEARWMAENVGLKEVEQLEPCRAFHAARLVAILEAYALHDPEIGYCQGMSDLLSPVISVMDDDSDAFFCFVNFMKRARHNFRLDEKGIKRQLGMVSKIIRFKDSNLYNHLEKLRAEDCFFVYRMVVVLFRRELTFEQTLCLWEVMWADQAAIRSGFGTSPSWARTRPKAPPTDDLLLYAIAACVLQMRKVIIERNSSMEEIMKECNCMAGNLDVWKLLDDAHELVLNLHEKV